MGILDEGESAEVNSLLNYLNDPKNWENPIAKSLPDKSKGGVIARWANSTGMGVQKVIKRNIVGEKKKDYKWEKISTTNWVDALKELWDNEEPMIVIRNDGEDIQIHEIFGWNESNLGLTGSQKEVDYNWVSIDVSPERVKTFVIEDDAHEESFVFENFKQFLATIGSTEIMEIKEDQGGGKWKTVEKPNYLSDKTGFLLVHSILIPKPYNLTLPKIMRDKMRKELMELRP
jgi:hypothetical protein